MGGAITAVGIQASPDRAPSGDGDLFDLRPNSEGRRRTAPSEGDQATNRLPYSVLTTEALDLDRHTVLPCFVDCHIHLGLGSSRSAARGHHACNDSDPHIALKDNLLRTLQAGVGIVRDGGDPNCIALKARDLVSSYGLPGPTVVATGRVIRRPGKYGSFLGPGIEGDRLEEAVEEAAAAGAAFVKVLVSGAVSFDVLGRVGSIQFSLEELRRIARRAHSLGLKVMAHANSDEAVRMAVRSGADSIEHGYFMCPATLKLLASAKVPWVPTAIPVAVQLESPRPQARHQERLQVIRETYESQLRAIRQAQDLGVILGVGTDAGAPGVAHGKAFLQELEIYRAAGLSVAEVLVAATRNGALVVGLQEVAGTIEPGKPACLIAVEGNPWTDFSAIRRVSHVFLPSGPRQR